MKQELCRLLSKITLTPTGSHNSVGPDSSGAGAIPALPIIKKGVINMADNGSFSSQAADFYLGIRPKKSHKKKLSLPVQNSAPTKVAVIPGVPASSETANTSVTHTPALNPSRLRYEDEFGVATRHRIGKGVSFVPMPVAAPVSRVRPHRTKRGRGSTRRRDR